MKNWYKELKTEKYDAIIEKTTDDDEGNPEISIRIYNEKLGVTGCLKLGFQDQQERDEAFESSKSEALEELADTLFNNINF